MTTISLHSLILCAVVMVSDGSLPQAAGDRLKQFHDVEAKVVADSKTRLDAARGELMSTLAKELKELSAAVMLDDAIEVRDLIRNVEKQPNDEAKERLLDGAVVKRSTNASTALRKYQELAAVEVSRRKKLLEENRQAVIADLTQLMESHAKAEQLDEAVAIRSEIRALKIESEGKSGDRVESIPVVKFDESMSYDDANRKRGEAIVALRKSIDTSALERLESIVKRLSVEQDATTRVGKLDEAVAIRDVINRLRSQRNVDAAVTSIAGIRDKLSEETRETFDNFRTWWMETSKSLNENVASIHREFQPFELRRIREKLTTNSTPDEVVATLMPYFAYKGAMPDWLASRGTRAIPNAGPLASSLLETYEAEVERLNSEADKKERVARTELLNAIRTPTDNDPRQPLEKEANAEVRDFLEAPHSTGLRGLMLLDIPSTLSEADLAATRTFVKETTRIKSDLRKERAAALEKLRSELTPLLDRHLAKEEFREAFAIVLRLDGYKYLFEPVRIKAIPSNGFGQPTDASLLDIQGRSYLVKLAPFGHEEWLPTSRVLLSDKRAAAYAAVPNAERAKRPAQPEGPGETVNDDTKLTKGMKGFVFWGSRWYPVTILDVTSMGIQIHWDGYSNGFDKVVKRSELRVLQSE